MKYRLLLLAFACTLMMQNIHSQSSHIQIGTQIPLIYSIGYEYKTNDKISINAQAGVLTKPYDKAILRVLQLYGVNDAIIFAINESFNYGFALQPTIKYHFTHFYIGATYSFYSLYTNHIKSFDIYNRYNFPLPEFFNQDVVSLNSNLSNAGLIIGHEFNFKSNFKIIVEASVQKTFYSHSTISSDAALISSLQTKVNEELNQYYLEYGYLPSVNIYFAKSF